MLSFRAVQVPYRGFSPGLVQIIRRDLNALRCFKKRGIADVRLTGRVQDEPQERADLSTSDIYVPCVGVNPVDDHQVAVRKHNDSMTTITTRVEAVLFHLDVGKQSALSASPPHIAVAAVRAEYGVGGRAFPNPIRRDDLLIPPAALAQEQKAEAGHVSRAHAEGIGRVDRIRASYITAITGFEILHLQRLGDTLIELLEYPRVGFLLEDRAQGVKIPVVVVPEGAWGVQSRFGVRDAGREPSRSGVVGLLCAALGRRRQESIADLASLHMGVRIDQEGTLLRDYHTAGKGGYLKASGALEQRNLIVSSRYYLADARFLVGLDGGDPGFLSRLHDALRDPVWPLYLGRKAFVPGEPVWLPDGLCADKGLEEALAAYPWLGSDPTRCPESVRWVLDDGQGPEVRPDFPLSFAERRFAPRRVSTRFMPGPPLRKEVPCTSPD